MRCPVCEHEIDIKEGKPHSLPQHRRFFGVIRALAKRYWPDTHPYQFFGDEIGLRKYLTIRAGPRFREVRGHVALADLHCPPELATLIAQETLKAAEAYSVPWVHNGELVILVAKSIKIHGRDAMPHNDFNALSQAVDEVIRAETGLDPDVILADFKKPEV
jgi:hypothetical protein